VEAHRAYKEMIIAVEDRIRKAIVPTWSKVLGEFVEASLNRGPMKKTVYDYRVCLEAHTLGRWGNRLIDSITTLGVRNLRRRTDQGDEDGRLEGLGNDDDLRA
jgi:hypothetical protein